MTIDLALNLLGLAISIGGLVAARLTRQTVFAILAAALVATTGVAAGLSFSHELKIARLQSDIMGKLAGNRWTFDRIYAEVHYVPYELVHEAVFRGVERGLLQHQPTECTVSSGGAILSTRVYYAAARP
jgi:hypothetical protein